MHRGRRPTTVASHRWNNIRKSPQPLKMLNCRLDNAFDISDAAAAGSNGYGLARANFFTQIEPRKLSRNGGRDILDRLGSKGLANAKRQGIGHY